MAVEHDNPDGPCACGAWHKPGEALDASGTRWPDPTENATAARRLSPCVSEDRGDHCTPGMPFRCNGCVTADAFTALLDEHDRQRDAALAAVAEFSAKALQAAFDDLARAQEIVETLRAEVQKLRAEPEADITGFVQIPTGMLSAWRKRAEKAEAQLRDVEAERGEALKREYERGFDHAVQDAATRFVARISRRTEQAESALAAQTAEVGRLRAALVTVKIALSMSNVSAAIGALEAARRPPTADEAGGTTTTQGGEERKEEAHDEPIG